MSLLVIPAYSQSKLLFIKLSNETDYHGKWDIAYHITDSIFRELNKKEKLNVLLQTHKEVNREMSKHFFEKNSNETDNLIDYSKALDIDIVLTGSIKKFSIATTKFVSPELGDWKIYTGICEINYQLIKVADETFFQKTASGMDKKHYLSGHFTNPAAFSGEQIIEYLEKYAFDSRDIKESVIGGAVTRARNSVISNILSKLPHGENNIQSKVIDIDQDFVYINVGTEKEAFLEQIFFVYERGENINDPSTGELLGFREKDIAKIKIDRVLGAKLSRAIIISPLSSNKKIAINQLVKPFNKNKQNEKITKTTIKK